MTSSIDSLSIPEPQKRASTSVVASGPNTPSFIIDSKNKSYKHQYSNIYFIRLRLLRDFVGATARRLWASLPENPLFVPRVLEVVPSQLCYVIGTVYMDMPLKPNVMDDVARDLSIPPPPPPPFYYSSEDRVMLEDESGRIELVGDRLKSDKLVTGVIIGALGMETPNGGFEVVDICYAGMAPQSQSQAKEEAGDSMDVDTETSTQEEDLETDEWIATVSGLNIGAPSPADGQIQMLVEYLTGEEGGLEDQVAASRISRLIIAGDSLAPMIITGKGEANAEGDLKKSRKFGYDGTTFSTHPTVSLSAHLLDIGRVMPIHLLPGEKDPSGIILPQQPLPRAMLGSVSSFPTFYCETNPTYLSLSSDSSPITRTLLLHSGQSVNDMFKYFPSPPHSRLSILESTLRWRHLAPTAPDTLWCHPYVSADPFLMTETPDIYIVGGQKKFMTKVVVDDGKNDGHKKRCRLVLVPEFSSTGVLVLVNLRTLRVKIVRFRGQGMSASAAESRDGVSGPSTSEKMSIVEEPESSLHSNNSSKLM